MQIFSLLNSEQQCLSKSQTTMHVGVFKCAKSNQFSSAKIIIVNI